MPTIEEIASIFRLLHLAVPSTSRLESIASSGRSVGEVRDDLFWYIANRDGVSFEQAVQQVIRQTFQTAGVNIATKNETEAERLSRIATSIISGDRTLREITTTIRSYSGGGGGGGGGGTTPPPSPTPAPPSAPEAPVPNPPSTNPPPALEPINYETRVAALYPYLPPALVKIFAEAWAQTGDANLALAMTRAHDSYEGFFPGIKRADGSLRMTEQEWFATREAYGRLFQEFGLNTSIFEGRFTQLMEGSVSPSELASRLGAVYEEIINDIPQVREYYARVNGVELSDQAIFASFLDPDVGDAILNRRISVASVGGEGLARGFDVAEPFAERLASAGVDQLAARQFFSQAEERLPTLDELARRFRDPDSTFDVEELAEASIFGSAGQGRRIRRLMAAETSLFTDQVGSIATDDELRVSGLTAR